MPSTEYFGLRAEQFQHSLERLRKKAEQRRAEEPSITDVPEQFQETVQELQLHKLELEMQYEELLIMQAETENMRARYTDLFDFAPVGYIVFDVLGVIHEVNLRATKFLNSTRLRLRGRRLLLFVMPECREEFLRFTVDVMSSDEQGLGIDLRMCREDGTPFHAHLDGIAIPDPWGNRQCRLAITDTSALYQSTTDLKTAVATISEGETKFQRLFAHSADAMMLLRNNYVLACNDAALQLYGSVDENDLIGRHLSAGAPATQPDGRPSRAVADEGLARALRLGTAEFEWVRQQAETREMMWHEVQMTALSLGADAVVHAVFRDMTALMRQECELHAQEELLQLSLAAAGRGLWTWDPTTDCLTLDKRTRLALQGHSDMIDGEDGTLATLLITLAPDDRARAEAEIRQSFDSPVAQVFNWCAVWPDGSRHRVASMVQVQPEIPGAAMRLNAVMTQVAEGIA